MAQRRFIQLTVLTCQASTIDIAGPTGPATWKEHNITFLVDSILRMERQMDWGRAYTRISTSDGGRFWVDESIEQINHAASEEY